MSNNRPTLQDEIKAPLTNPRRPRRRQLQAPPGDACSPQGFGKSHQRARGNRTSQGVAILLASSRPASLWRTSDRGAHQLSKMPRLCGGLRLGIHPS